MRVLLIDQDSIPLKIIDYKKAMRLIFQNKVRVEKIYPNKKIRTVSQEFDFPAVVWQFEKDKRTKSPLSPTRYNVLLRDKKMCAYCGKKCSNREATLDHVKPLVQSGKSVWNNLVTACLKCNQSKAGRTPAQAGMKLLYLPKTPPWSMTFSLNFTAEDFSQMNEANEKVTPWTDYVFELDLAFKEAILSE